MRLKKHPFVVQVEYLGQIKQMPHLTRCACCCRNHGCHRFDVKIEFFTRQKWAIWMGAYSLTPRHLNFGADCLMSTPASHLTIYYIYFNKRHPSGQSGFHESKWTFSHCWQIVIEGTGMLLEDELDTFWDYFFEGGAAWCSNFGTENSAHCVPAHAVPKSCTKSRHVRFCYHSPWRGQRARQVHTTCHVSNAPPLLCVAI